MGDYKSAEKRIKEKLAYWRKVGFDIVWTKMPDGVMAKFTNHSERIPCYVEYKDDFIICYGDYGGFVFHNVGIGANPLQVNFASVDYILRKVENNGGNRTPAEEFDRDQFRKDMCGWRRGYRDDGNSIFCSKFKEAWEEIDWYDICDENMYSELSSFFDKIGYEGWEEETEGFGMIYTDFALAQLVIFQLCAEDYEKKNGGGKDAAVCPERGE